MPEESAYYGDNLTPEQRSRAMRAVRSRDTKPERALRRALRNLGVNGYRVDVAGLPGRPDLTFNRHQLAVFVDGGYWHGRPDRVRPGRSPYWDRKIQRNVERDRQNASLLQENGWRILRLWDDEVTGDPDRAARRVKQLLSPRPCAEFFAGMGLVGMGLAEAGFEVAFANDIDGTKRSLYAANRDPSKFVWGDIRHLHGKDVPSVDLASASFPCTDLSLAGNRNGLNGTHSSTFWEFVRILGEMGERAPKVLVIENVSGFASSGNGSDLALAISALNGLGYGCDIVQLDAKHWVPQSRVRVFVVGFLGSVGQPPPWIPSEIRPSHICQFASRNPQLLLRSVPLPPLPTRLLNLRDAIERMDQFDQRWWSSDRTARFMSSLSGIQLSRVMGLAALPEISWRTAYRRTRHGRAVWEIRADDLAGCLRTARGGSSKQAVVESGGGHVRVRWMTPREYAALMGVPNLDLSPVSPNQALFGLGDAVCVPAVAWLATNYLRPLVDGHLTDSQVEHGATA